MFIGQLFLCFLKHKRSLGVYESFSTYIELSRLRARTFYKNAYLA